MREIIGIGQNGLHDVDMEFAMMAVPTGILERWAEGEWPEPHCGVCRGVWGFEDAEDFPGYSETEIINVQRVIDYHDEPLRTAPRRSLWKANRATYERCLRVYETARSVLDARTASRAA